MIDDTVQTWPRASIPWRFDRFQRDDGLVPRAHCGSGLALATGKDIADGFGGEITPARSRMDGVSIHLLLPCG